jgi:hypothetical protein
MEDNTHSETAQPLNNPCKDNPLSPGCQISPFISATNWIFSQTTSELLVFIKHIIDFSGAYLDIHNVEEIGMLMLELLIKLHDEVVTRINDIIYCKAHSNKLALRCRSRETSLVTENFTSLWAAESDIESLARKVNQYTQERVEQKNLHLFSIKNKYHRYFVNSSQPETLLSSEEAQFKKALEDKLRRSASVHIPFFEAPAALRTLPKKISDFNVRRLLKSHKADEKAVTSIDHNTKNNLVCNISNITAVSGLGSATLPVLTTLAENLGRTANQATMGQLDHNDLSGGFPVKTAAGVAAAILSAIGLWVGIACYRRKNQKHNVPDHQDIETAVR